MVPINLTCQHCLQHFFFEHLLHLYWRLHSTFVLDKICFLVRPIPLLEAIFMLLTIFVSNSSGMCGGRPRRTPTSNLPDNRSPSVDLGTLKCSAAFLTDQPFSCMASTAACSCASSYLTSCPLLVGMYFFGILSEHVNNVY